MASTKRRPKGVKGGPKASQRTRLEDLMTVLNDLELKGHMRELLGATSSWNTSDVHDYSDVQGMPPPRLPSHQEHVYSMPGVVQPLQVARKRKARGKEKSIQEAAATLRALKIQHECLARIQQELFASRHQPIATQVSLRALVPDHLLHTLVPQRARLHIDSFLQSEMVRFLIPFELDKHSILVDCSEAFARQAGSNRDNLVRGTKLSQLVEPVALTRFQQLAPLVSSCGAIYIRNAPGYADNILYDIVVSTEAEARPVRGSGAQYPDHSDVSTKRRHLRRHIQIMIFNPRPLRLRPAALASSTSRGSSGTSSPSESDMSVHMCSRSPTDSSFDNFDPMTFLDEASFGASSPEIETTSVATTSVAVEEPTSSVLDQAMFIQPMHPHEDSAPAHGWLTTWGAEEVATGVVAPMVRIEGDAARRVQQFFNDREALAAAGTHTTSIDTTATQLNRVVVSDIEMKSDDHGLASDVAVSPVVGAAAGDETPVIKYYTL